MKNPASGSIHELHEMHMIFTLASVFHYRVMLVKFIVLTALA
jgi:hypothetical protein